jgi:hypothetical protein
MVDVVGHAPDLLGGSYHECADYARLALFAMGVDAYSVHDGCF